VHPCQLKLNPSPPAPLPLWGEGSKRVWFPFSHAKKAPASSGFPLLKGDGRGIYKGGMRGVQSWG